MKNKKIVLLIITLIIATFIFPATGKINIEKTEETQKNIAVESSGSHHKMLPMTFYRILNKDWDYWSNTPHLYSIPEGNVGIGTDNPSKKLEVAGTVKATGLEVDGNVQVNGDISFETKTGYISISPAAFRPARDWYEFMCNGISLRNIDSSSDTYYAPLELPHGSRITNMTWYWYDSSSADGSLWIYRSDFDTTLHPIGSCLSSGSSGDGSSYDNSVSQPWIDNSQYHYYLSVTLEDSDIYCYGAKIEYTYTKI